tara:strand:- start:1301 stop:1657 length:357 start_codon:yes stop_codon:yes gene_type:complete
MFIKINLLAIVLGITIFIVIIELVRRRKLREEYSWLWLLTGSVIITLAIFYNLLFDITELIGAENPISTLFFFSTIFLILLCLQFSVQISKFTNQIRKLAQELAILKTELNRRKNNIE